MTGVGKFLVVGDRYWDERLTWWIAQPDSKAAHQSRFTANP
jgi:hypothetical protein